KLGAGGSSSLLPFMVSAAIFALYAILLVVLMLLFKLEEKEKSAVVSINKMARIVFTDKVFLYFLLGKIFVAGAYSHLDTTLSQYIGHDR
ncbi:MFS transporter, partial [Bacillus sp. SIMBA_069]